MHILMISDVYFPRVNGVSTSIHTFIQAHKKLGNQVTLVCPDYSAPEEQSKIDALEDSIIRLPARKILFDPEDRLIKAATYEILKGSVKNEHFDLIHIQTPFMAHRFGLRLAKELKLPVVETYHTYFEEYFHHYIPFVPKAILKSLSRSITRRQCNKLDAVIVPSSAMQSVLADYGIHKPIKIIPTGLQLNEFENGDGTRFRQKHAIPESRPVLTYVGRVALEKNIAFLLQVLVKVKHHIPDVLLVIAGEGPARDSLHKLTKQLGIEDNVIFIGYMDRATELLDCYKAGNAFVFASRTETQGLVLLEALACGLPVISTAVMGTKDVLNEEDGGCLIADDNNINDFTQKTVKLLTDAQLQHRLSHQGQEYVLQWTAMHFAQKVTKYYQTITNPVPCQAPKSAQEHDQKVKQLAYDRQ